MDHGNFLSMKLHKKLTLAFGLAASFGVQAGLISDYVLDETTNIVTDTANGIEWLQWDQTTGMSINEALSAFNGAGWQLATNSQMADLFNAFDLSYGGFIWTNEENLLQTYDGPTDGIAIEDWSNDRELQFVSLFSDTAEAWPNEGTCGVADCLQMSAAYFGSDNDNDGQYKVARIVDDLQFDDGSGYQDLGSLAEMSNDIIDLNTDTAYSRGVALVRVVNVPEPQSLAILFLGIAGLLAYRAKKA
jgi:hypothetical protein